MEPESWRQRWREGRIGFHLDRVNPNLEKFFPRLTARPGETVFVPLCGKSRDLHWITQRGHAVIGVEISPIAVQAFFDEHGRRPMRRTAGNFERWEDNGLQLLCGDFFTLQPQDVAPARLFHDRAALIALPAPMRARYAERMAELLPDTACGLLITLEYRQEAMSGPPFSVDETEVHALYGRVFEIERLARRSVLETQPRFREQGLDALTEAVYLLRRR